MLFPLSLSFYTCYLYIFVYFTFFNTVEERGTIYYSNCLKHKNLNNQFCRWPNDYIFYFVDYFPSSNLYSTIYPHSFRSVIRMFAWLTIITVIHFKEQYKYNTLRSDSLKSVFYCISLYVIFVRHEHTLIHISSVLMNNIELISAPFARVRATTRGTRS